MSESTADHRRDLLRSLQFVAGVGPQRAEKLERLGLRTVADVLFYFPRSYEDLTTTTKIHELVDGQEATVLGVVHQIDRQVTRAGKVIVGVLIQQDMQLMRALWFNPTFGIRDLQRGTWVAVRGKPKKKTMRWEMTHPRIMRLDLPESPDLQQLANPSSQVTDVASNQAADPQKSSDHHWLGKFRPVYGLTEGLSQGEMRKIATTIAERYAELLTEALPRQILERHQLAPIIQAVHGIHLPKDQADVDAARARLVYQELLALQIGLAMRRHRMQSDANAPVIQDTAKIRGRILRLFPFELTTDQIQAIDEVCSDLQNTIPMNRMLQGDVGSGKTMVAIYSTLLAVACGFQVAIMAPTDVLARQHFETLQNSLKKGRVQLGLLTGSVPAAERKTTEDALQKGKIDVIIGTQTLIRSEIPWNRLGLVIIDEGHKFGVRQRAKMKQAGFDPHYLVMTATPIPRSAAMTLFGDLDLSIIRHAPAGRQVVRSYPVPPEKRESWWAFFRKQIDAGHQGFVVVPRIEANENTPDLTSATEVYDELTKGPLAGLRVELLHGQMPAEEKNRIMHSMSRGLTQVLVSTTVIEVGIDVPNATVMAIYLPQLLGLSQLHQLRGRVGRGKHAGYVGLLTDELNEASTERLQLFCRTTDGFELAEADLQMRGPGDFFGTRQHGMPPLMIANLQKDQDWLLKARRDAQDLVKLDPDLAAEELQRLRQLVMAKYGDALELGDVG